MPTVALLPVTAGVPTLGLLLVPAEAFEIKLGKTFHKVPVSFPTAEVDSASWHHAMLETGQFKARKTATIATGGRNSQGVQDF